MGRARFGRIGACVLAAGCCACVAVPGGCAGPDRGYVQREWSTTLRELGIVPVFPPREDVFVGDVYAYDFDPDSLETDALVRARWGELSRDDQVTRMRIGMSPRLARVDLTTAAFNEYKATPAWPATPADGGGELGPGDARFIKARLEQAERAEREAVAAKESAAGVLAQKVRAAEERKAQVDAGESRRAAASAERNEASSVLVKRQAEADTAQSHLTAAINDRTVTDERRRLLEQERDRTRGLVADAKTRVTKADAAAEAAEAAMPELRERERAARVEQDKAQRGFDTAAKAATDAEGKRKSIEDAARALGPAPGSSAQRQPRSGDVDVFTGQPLGDVTRSDPVERADQLQNARVNRLRLVGFPDFSSTTFTRGELSALVPIEAFALGGRLNFTRVRRVSVRVPAAESYSVPIEHVARSVLERNKATEGAKQGEGKDRTLATNLLDAARFQFHRPGGTGTMYLRVVTEVYYARALDITIEATRAAGARAELEMIKPFDSVEGRAPTPIELQNPQAGTVSGDPGSLTNAQVLTRTEAQLGERLKVPGGSVQLVSLTSTHVGLRRVFDRPVAIGVRGLTLQVNADGTVERVDPALSGAPTLAPNQQQAR